MKWKRPLAIIALVIIGLLYVVALICACINHPLAKSILMAAIFTTFVLPVMLYGYIIIYQHTKRRIADSSKTASEAAKQSEDPPIQPTPDSE